MARIREEDYAYATARIRSIETKLINKSKLERLLDMSDPSDAMKLLMESGYGTDRLDNSKDGAANVEVLLSSEHKKAYDFLFDILPDPEIAYLFMRRYDYLNAKLILKAEFLGMNVKSSLSPLGTVKPEVLIRIITERKLSELPEIFGKAILESLDSFNQTGDPQNIDFILDRASYENMMEDAKRTEEPFLIELVERLSDSANIRVFIRSKLLSRSGDFIRRALVKGGKLPENIFEELSDKNIEQFFDAMKANGLEKLAQDLSSVVKNPNGLTEVEKVLEDSIIVFLGQSKYDIFGVKPVVAYLFFKETEIKNARLIMTGKTNKISQETIKERLRLGYA